MVPPSHETTVRTIDHSRGDTSLAGLLGYLAVCVAGLALLSAPLVAAVTLVALGVTAAGVRWLADRQQPAKRGNETAATVASDTVTE
jgi:hypothetical protein